jgi:hypothetical protein
MMAVSVETFEDHAGNVMASSHAARWFRVWKTWDRAARSRLKCLCLKYRWLLDHATLGKPRAATTDEFKHHN